MIKGTFANIIIHPICYTETMDDDKEAQELDEAEELEMEKEGL